MITRLLDAVARAALARPRAVLALALGPALLALHAFAVPVDLSFAALMDREHPEVARYFEASQRYGLGGLLPALVEGPEARLDEAVAALERALSALDVVASVSGEPPWDWIADRAPWLVDDETFAAWIAFASAPGDEARARDLERRLGELRAAYGVARHEGDRLVVVRMRDDGFELALDADHFPRIRAVAREALAPYGARAHFAGMPAIVTQEQEATLRRMSVLGPISLLAVVLLLTRIERRVAVLAGVAAAMLLSLGTTLALVGLLAGRLTLMESVFGVLVFGLGVDFAIHLRVRMREERGRGLPFDESLMRAVRGTGHGIVAGGLTTSGAFLIMGLAPDPVFRTLGLSGGLGLLLCLVFLVAFLPAQWTWLARREASGRARPHPPAPVMRADWIVRIASRAAGRPAPVLAVTLLLVVAGAIGLTRLHYETNLERVFSREIEAAETARRIHALYGIDPRPWLVAVDDPGEAGRIAEAFRAEPLFSRADSIASFLPRDVARRATVLEVTAPMVEARAASLELARRAATGERAAELDRALDALRSLVRARALGPPGMEDLPAVLRERLVAQDGRLLVYAFASEPHLDSATAARERRVAQAIHPEATSMSAIFEALIGTERPWMPPLVAAVLLYIGAILYLDLRRVRLVALALMPVVAGSVVAVGGLSWLGFSFNTVTLVGMPLLLGLGVDDGIHVVHRLLEEPDRSAGEVVGAVGRSITMTTVTTCASVAALLFTQHPGLESVAVVLLVGLPLCLLASIALIPACARACLAGVVPAAVPEEEAA